MKSMALLGLLASMVVASQASAANVLVNGDWSTGDETGWTRWRAPWGGTENWAVTFNGPTPPEGTLSLGAGTGSFGWYQVVPAPPGYLATVSASWTGNIGGAGWADIMLFTTSNPNEDWAYRIDVGSSADIAFKKDSWGMNPPTVWGWQDAWLSPHPSGNGGIIVSQGYVCVGLKLGSVAPLGSVSFDNIVLDVIPEPAALSLLALGACLPLLRRSRRQGLALIRRKRP